MCQKVDSLDLITDLIHSYNPLVLRVNLIKAKFFNFDIYFLIFRGCLMTKFFK